MLRQDRHAIGAIDSKENRNHGSTQRDAHEFFNEG
jgi:hypothetical protein